MEWDVEVENSVERLNGRKGKILSKFFTGAQVQVENGENLFLTNEQFEYIVPNIENKTSQTNNTGVK
jgi:hypothetical protein